MDFRTAVYCLSAFGGRPVLPALSAAEWVRWCVRRTVGFIAHGRLLDYMAYLLSFVFEKPYINSNPNHKYS